MHPFRAVVPNLKVNPQGGNRTSRGGQRSHVKMISFYFIDLKKMLPRWCIILLLRRGSKRFALVCEDEKSLGTTDLEKRTDFQWSLRVEID